MATRRLAISVVVGATAVSLWPGLAWAYGNGGTTTGGGGLGETVGHSGGASNDAPPMGVTNDRPAPGSPETVSESATACVPGAPVTVALTYVGPSSTPLSFGSVPASANGPGGFSLTGTIPQNATGGTWVIFATCSDGSGNTLIYTATIVIPAGVSGSGLRSAAAGSGATGSASAGAAGTGDAAASSGSAGPAGAGAAGGAAQGPHASMTWTPPATWGTPALRALVAPAVNAAAASAPVVLAVTTHPVVAHTTGAVGSGAPWRDGVEGLAGLVSLVGLVRLNRRHHERRRNRWNSGRRDAQVEHRSYRRRPRARRVFGSKPRGMW